MTRVYISGPISGLDDYAPAFDAAVDRPARAGLEPVSPLDIGLRDGWDWWDYMRAAIELQRTCDEIYMLPGWRESRGATAEWLVAQALGQRITGATA